MAKPIKCPDTQLKCFVAGPEDYVFIPLQHLHPDYVVGTDADKPVYINDSPDYRKSIQQSDAAEEFKRRVDNGEHLYPQPDPYKNSPSFAVNDRVRFGFGDVRFVRIEQPGDIRVYQHYNDNRNFRPDDGVEIIFRGSRLGLRTSPLSVLL